MTDDEQPMDQAGSDAGHALCGAAKRGGGTCTLTAGHGTTHLGIGRCKFHGGSTPNHERSAQRVQAERDVELFGARRDVHPAEALLELVQWTAGEVDYWRQEVRRLDADDLTWGVTKVKEGGDDRGTTEEAKPAIEYVMLVDASNRLERYSASALKAGADEAMVRIAESLGGQLAGVLQAFAAAQLRSTLEVLAEHGDARSLVESSWGPAVSVNAPSVLRAIGAGS